MASELFEDFEEIENREVEQVSPLAVRRSLEISKNERGCGRDDRGVWTVSLQPGRSGLPIFRDVYGHVMTLAKDKFDELPLEMEVRLDHRLKLKDGSLFFEAGLLSLVDYAPRMARSVAMYHLAEGDVEDLARYVNRELDRREKDWSDRGRGRRRYFVRKVRVGGDVAVRAVMSQEYSPVDTARVIDLLSSAIENFEAPCAHAWSDDDDVALSVLISDRVGLTIRNSEVGKQILSIKGFVHVGDDCGELGAGLSWDSSVDVLQKHAGRIDLVELGRQIKRAAVVLAAEGKDVLRVLKDAGQIHVVNPRQVIAFIARENRLTQSQSADWWRIVSSLVTEEVSARDLVLGLSKTACRSYASARCELELLAGRLLSTGADVSFGEIEERWSSLAQAASHIEARIVDLYAPEV